MQQYSAAGFWQGTGSRPHGWVHGLTGFCGYGRLHCEASEEVSFVPSVFLPASSLFAFCPTRGTFSSLCPSTMISCLNRPSNSWRQPDDENSCNYKPNKLSLLWVEILRHFVTAMETCVTKLLTSWPTLDLRVSGNTVCALQERSRKYIAEEHKGERLTSASSTGKHSHDFLGAHMSLKV